METSKKKSFSPKRVKSSHFRVANRSYFLDINLASNDKKYLKITRSLFMGEGNDRKYDSVVIFPEDIEGFQKSLKEVVSYIN
ncbi:MAG: DUF3276 family protein [Candidatus Curtissbacteria bacterium]|nr:DUF3276 family protein [Candidatus Curtissbacteria bacterium]